MDFFKKLKKVFTTSNDSNDDNIEDITITCVNNKDYKFCLEHDEEIQKVLHANNFFKTKYNENCFQSILYIQHKNQEPTIEGFGIISKERSPKLSYFCISPKYQGQTIGSKFLMMIENNFKTVFKSLGLMSFQLTLEAGEATKGFYEKQGYSVSGKWELANEPIIYHMIKNIDLSNWKI